MEKPEKQTTQPAEKQGEKINISICFMFLFCLSVKKLGHQYTKAGRDAF
jgi:hypothetical protein